MRLDVIMKEDLPVTVGRYTLTGLLGEGGMARVFRARMEGDLGFVKPAAVKVVLSATGEKGAELRQQLIQEARLGGFLNHPNVVQTFDCGELDGFPYIAMELVDGVDVGQLVGELGPLPPGVALDIAIQVCVGLHHAHIATNEGQPLHLIHRDIKPSNIILRTDGVAKVMDFGIAKAAMPDSHKTATGMTKGTPSYMSPEQLEAKELTPASDLFAVGAVLFYMLTGKVLFGGSSITEVMLGIMRVNETVAVRGILATYDAHVPGLGEAMRRVLVKDPGSRYATLQEFEVVLRELSKGLPAEPTLGQLVEGAFGETIRRKAAEASSLSNPSVATNEPMADDGFPATVALSTSEAGTPTVAPRMEPPPQSVAPPAPPAPPPDPEATRLVPASEGRDLVTAEIQAARAEVARQRKTFIVVGGVVVAVLLGVIGWLVRPGPAPEPMAQATPEVAAADTPPPAVVAEASPAPEALPRARRRPRPTPAPTPRPVPTPAPPRAPAAIPTPAAAARKHTPTPAVHQPSSTPAPAAGVVLKIKHKPIRRAAQGTTVPVMVRVKGPTGTRVTVRFGPRGGPYSGRQDLVHKGGDRYEGAIKILPDYSDGMEYWIEASHPDAAERAKMGSAVAPLQVRIF